MCQMPLDKFLASAQQSAVTQHGMCSTSGQKMSGKMLSDAISITIQISDICRCGLLHANRPHHYVALNKHDSHTICWNSQKISQIRQLEPNDMMHYFVVIIHPYWPTWSP